MTIGSSASPTGIGVVREEDTATTRAPWAGALQKIGTVVAPWTLLAALLFYFGWVRTTAQGAFFGIDSKLLGFSAQDYELRSLGTLYWPLVLTFSFGLAAVWIHVLVLNLVRRMRRAGIARAVVLGGLAVGIGISGLAILDILTSPTLFTSPLWLSIGIVITSYGVYLLGQIRAQASRTGTTGPPWLARANAVLLTGLLLLALFWTVGDYAYQTGVQTAQRIAANLSALPDATVYSSRRLQIDAAGVEEAVLGGGESAFRFRYSGLHLLIQSGDRYFLLAEGWRSDERTIVLTESESLRFEFSS